MPEKKRIITATRPYLLRRGTAAMPTGGSFKRRSLKLRRNTKEMREIEFECEFLLTLRLFAFATFNFTLLLHFILICLILQSCTLSLTVLPRVALFYNLSSLPSSLHSLSLLMNYFFSLR